MTKLYYLFHKICLQESMLYNVKNDDVYDTLLVAQAFFGDITMSLFLGLFVHDTRH